MRAAPWILFFCVLVRSAGAVDPPRASDNSMAAMMAANNFQRLGLQRRLGNHLWVETAINGNRARLVVDSGAPVTVISSRKRRDLRACSDVDE